MKNIVSLATLEKLLKAYRAHLTHTGALAARTCDTRTCYAREFLQAYLSPARNHFDLQAARPELLLNHIWERSEHDSPARLQQMASSLRSFCRFLFLTGRSGGDLLRSAQDRTHLNQTELATKRHKGRKKLGFCAFLCLFVAILLFACVAHPTDY